MSQLNEPGPSSHPPSPSWLPSSNHSPAPSESGSSGFSNSCPPSRSHSYLRLPTRHPISVDHILHWPKEQQTCFENCIARLTASAGFPLSWVDNTEWIDFCTEFLPSRKTLTNRLLLAAVDKLRASARAAAKGHEATLQA